jgi:hypothetical protein
MGGIGASWFETRQRVRAKRGPMINSDALLTMRDGSRQCDKFEAIAVAPDPAGSKVPADHQCRGIGKTAE